MKLGDALLAAAMRQLGTPFRLHGRDPAIGVDCVGFVAACFEAIGRRPPVPCGYAMRWTDLAAIDRAAIGAGLVAAPPAIEAGDILLVRPGPVQLHLLITAYDEAIIHAHAGLRRVVMGPRPPGWASVRHWRLTEQG